MSLGGYIKLTDLKKCKSLVNKHKNSMANVMVTFLRRALVGMKVLPPIIWTFSLFKFSVEQNEEKKTTFVTFMHTISFRNFSTNNP